MGIARAALEHCEIKWRVVVKILACSLVERGVPGVIQVSRQRLRSDSTLSLREDNTQASRSSTVSGNITRSQRGGRYGVRNKSAICHMQFRALTMVSHLSPLSLECFRVSKAVSVEGRTLWDNLKAKSL